jgi:hypothetical protein
MGFPFSLDDLKTQALGQVQSLAQQTLSSATSFLNGAASQLEGQVFSDVSNGIGLAKTSSFPSGQKDPLAAARARPDPLMNFNWWCDMPILNGSTAIGWEYVEEATLPFIEFEQISNYRAGKNFHFPHHYSLGTLSLKFYEDSYGTVASYLKTWQSMVLNTGTGLYYFPKDFKKTISIWILDVAKQTVMCLDYTGAWPMRPESYNFGSSQSERIVAGCEFSVDELNVKVGKFDSTNIPSAMSTFGMDFPPMISALPDVFPSNFVNLSF